MAPEFAGKMIGQTEGDYVWSYCPKCRGEKWTRQHLVGSDNIATTICYSCCGRSPVRDPPKPYDRRPTTKGYILIFLPPTDKYYDLVQYNHKSVDGGWVAEHRWVASQKLGRLLRKGEHVYHLNQKRDDNNPDNLEIRIGLGQPASEIIEEIEEFMLKMKQMYGGDK